MMDFTSISRETRKKFVIENYLPEIGIDDTRNEILKGLLSTPKRISSKYFYDSKGSDLFEKITCLDEYYPTRAEKSILETHLPGFLHDVRNINIVELGSGDCSKISILFNAIKKENHDTITYYPVDVSQPAIEKSADQLGERFPGITIKGIVADFMSQLHLVNSPGKTIYCFFGSTLGNFTKDQAIQFLIDLRKTMKPGDELLLGIDMVKDIKILEAAYNDVQQVTKAFNQNILNVVNQLAVTNFVPGDFEHVSFYNPEFERVEMHLEATRDMEISSEYLDKKVWIKKGERIHTENSHKFTMNKIQAYTCYAGLGIKKVFTDNRKWFTVLSLVHS